MLGIRKGLWERMLNSSIVKEYPKGCRESKLVFIKLGRRWAWETQVIPCFEINGVLET